MLQPTPKDKTKLLYDAVSADYDLGTYEEFSTKLQNPEKRQAFYTGVGQEYALGTYEEFESKVIKKKEEQETTLSPYLSGEAVSDSDGTKKPDLNALVAALAPRKGPFPHVKGQEKGTTSSHLMAQQDNVAFPTIFQNEDGTWTKQFTDFSKARKEAEKRGEVFEFDSEQEAMDFADGAWKKDGPPETYQEELENPPPQSQDIPVQEVDQPIADLYKAYEEASVVTPQNVADIESKLKDQEEGNRGFWETASAVTEGFLKTGVFIPLFQYDNRKSLIAAREQQNKTKFLEALPPEKVEDLRLHAGERITELDSENLNVVAENSMMMERAKEMANTLKYQKEAIITIRENNQPVPPEALEDFNTLYNKFNDLNVKHNSNIDILEANTEDIGNFYEEVNLLKKNYGGLDYYQDIARLASADIMAGAAQLSMDISEGVEGVTGIPAPVKLLFDSSDIKDFRQEVSRQREDIKPLMSVQDIGGETIPEMLSSFGGWLAEQTASQLPVITVLAASGGQAGLGLLGAGAAGQKIGELKDERDLAQEKILEYSKILQDPDLPQEQRLVLEAEIKSEQKSADITDNEAFMAGIAVGSFEILSERITLGILSKGRRAITAGYKAGKADVKRGVVDYIQKNTAANSLTEGGSEFLNQVGTNMVDMLYLGNPDVHVFDGAVDALASGTAMGVGMTKIPQAIGFGVSTFTKADKSKEIAEDANKVADLLGEMENKAVSPAMRKMLKKKASKLSKKIKKDIKKTYEGVQELPKADIQELINISKSGNELAQRVKLLQESPLVNAELHTEMLDEIQNEVDKLTTRKAEILDKKKDEPTEQRQEEPKKAKAVRTEAVKTQKETGVAKTQKVIDELTSERIPHAKQKPSAKPQKLSKIVANVSNKLKSTLVYGGVKGRRTIGSYNPRNALVRIKTAGDLNTVAHELGHLLDDKYELLKNVEKDKKVTNQLRWFSNRGGSNPPAAASAAQKTDYLKREGLAEFIRAYVANPKEAKNKAPELYEHFESSLDPGTKAALESFSQEYLDFANSPAGERIIANVEGNVLAAEKTRLQKARDRFQALRREMGVFKITPWDKFQQKWTNSMKIAFHAFEFVTELKGDQVKTLKPEKNFIMMTRLFAGITTKINNALNIGLVDTRNKVRKDSKGKVMNIKYLIDILDNSSEKTLLGEMDDVIKLLISERTLEYAKRFERARNLTGIGGGITSDLQVAQEHLSDFQKLKKEDPKKYKRIKEGARRYREFADAGLRYAVESGRLSEESYKQIKENNQYYVSMARTKEVTAGEDVLDVLTKSSKLTSVADVIKKARGGSNTIKNPYLSLLKNTVNIMKESDRNQVMRTFMEPLTEKRHMGQGKPLDFSQIARPASAGEKNVIRIFKEGEQEHWQFDQDIYENLKSIGEVTRDGALISVMRPLATTIRNTVTTFPVFAVRNIVRDALSRMVLSRTKGKLTDLSYSKETRRAFENYGGSQAGFHLTNEKAYVGALSEAVTSITRKGKGVVLDPRKLKGRDVTKGWRNWKKLLEKGENWNRIAEYKSAYKQAIKDGMDEYNAGLYAAFQARDLMDFAVAGEWMKEINKVIPFSNASVQSIKRSIKGAKEKPDNFALRMAIYTILPQFITRALVHANGDDEEYEELPDYQRDLFWNFKTPMTGDMWISIPKPFELGLASSIVDRGISVALGNKDAFEGATMSSLNTIFPFDASTLGGAFKPILEAAFNYDFFRQKNIVPYWEEGKTLELREGTKYASRVSQGLSDAFGLIGAEVDPRKIDHVIKGYTTYWGNHTLAAFDIGKEDSSNQYDFTKTGFARGMPVSNAKSVKKALDLAKDIGQEGTSAVKELKGMIKFYYDLGPKTGDDAKTKEENATARKQLTKDIYEYSKELIQDLKLTKADKLKEIREIRAEVE